MAEDWLDRLAKQAEPYLPDGGFADSVMRRLPAPRELKPRTEIAILGSAAALGSAVAAASVPWRPLLEFLVNSTQVPAIALSCVAGALLIAGGVELARRV